MEKNNGFIFSGRYILIILVVGSLLILSGCGVNGSIDHNTPGLFNHYIVYPFSYLIQHIALWFQGNYGMAIIIMTLMVRLVLLPFMMSQSRKQVAMKHKMSMMQPELNKLKEKYKDSQDPEAKSKLQQETLQLYTQHQFNPLAIGCLPMLIQLPILSGLYYAIKATPELATHSFLWFQLGQPDMILPFVAALIYFFQYKVSQIGTDPAQAKQLAFVGYLSPIMMGVFSFTAPAAIPLYWVVGGIFIILQTALAKRLYPPIVQKEILPQ